MSPSEKRERSGAEATSEASVATSELVRERMRNNILSKKASLKKATAATVRKRNGWLGDASEQPQLYNGTASGDNGTGDGDNGKQPSPTNRATATSTSGGGGSLTVVA